MTDNTSLIARLEGVSLDLGLPSTTTLDSTVIREAAAELRRLNARVAELEGALNKARDQGRQPDYCYDDEWEYTLRFDEWPDLVDSHDLSDPVEVNTLFKGPTKWAINVPNSFDEDGVPDGWDTVMFDSATDARAALKGATP